jgi:hypothetical protein
MDLSTLPNVSFLPSQNVRLGTASTCAPSPQPVQLDDALKIPELKVTSAPLDDSLVNCSVFDIRATTAGNDVLTIVYLHGGTWGTAMPTRTG